MLLVLVTFRALATIKGEMPRKTNCGQVQLLNNAFNDYFFDPIRLKPKPKLKISK